MFRKSSLQTIARLFLCVALVVRSTVAFETDQYNLPTRPLADIGDEVSEYVEQNLVKALAKINAEIAARQLCVEYNAVKLKNIKCDTPNKQKAKLAFLRSDEAIAREVYNLLGSGVVPFTKSGGWMESHRFKAQPARYKTDYQKSIFFSYPANYLTVSATVNLYGSEFGTDKIAHFFQQGYDYYRIYKRAFADELSADEAARKAIAWGRLSERTFYGTLISGVYSNADLCANYAGMKFYQGLTKPTKIGGAAKPAVFQLKNGVWTFGDSVDRRKMLLKPFISRHFNEAFNPSIFSNTFGLRAYVRQTVRKQSCAQWRSQFSDLSATDLNEISRALELWNGEDYGFTESRHFVTIANTCFADGNAVTD